jgi:hypothetical protein
VVDKDLPSSQADLAPASTQSRACRESWADVGEEPDPGAMAALDLVAYVLRARSFGESFRTCCDMCTMEVEDERGD